MPAASIADKKIGSFRCDRCGKDFVNEVQLISHKEMEHIKHIPLAGVG